MCQKKGEPTKINGHYGKTHIRNETPNKHAKVIKAKHFDFDLKNQMY
jgi:hypothetical protein